MKQYKEVSADKQKKKRKFLLVLPIIILPFLTFLFWSLGLVGATEVKASSPADRLNMQLPDAKLKDNKSWNKLSFYEQADKDSAKYKEAIKNDPFFHNEKDSLSHLSGKSNNSFSDYNPLPPNYEDVNEYKVNQKLAELNAVISKPTVDNKPLASNNAPQKVSGFQPQEVDRLE